MEIDSLPQEDIFTLIEVECGLSPASYNGDGIAFEYDSTGGMMKTGRNEAYETEMFRDGAGREAKRSNRVWDGEEEEWGEWKTTYSLYSSVLGRVVSEAVETGAKRRTFVVAGGTEIARQAYSEESEQVVGFVHRDASGLSGRSTNAGTGTASSTYASVAEEFDALGNNVGTRGHLSRPPHEGGSMPTSNDTITFDDMTLGQCSIDGVIALCSMMDRMGDAMHLEVRRWDPHARRYTRQYLPFNRDLPGRYSMSIWIPDELGPGRGHDPVIVDSNSAHPEFPPAGPGLGQWLNFGWGVSLQSNWTINRIRSSENTEIDFAKLNACLRSVFGQTLEVELIGLLNTNKMSFSVNGGKSEWLRPKIESLTIDLSLSAKQISDHQLGGLVGYSSAYLTSTIASSAVHRPTIIHDLSSASDRWIEKLEEMEAFKNAENVTFYFPKDDLRSLGTETSVLSGLATGLALAIYQNPVSITPQGTVVDQVQIAKDKLLRCYQE